MKEPEKIGFTRKELEALQQILHENKTVDEILNEEAGFSFEQARKKIDEELDRCH